MPKAKLVPGLILDTTKIGLDAFVQQPWQAQVMKELFTRENFISREIHEFCEENDIKSIKGNHTGKPISRASVINFLNKLVNHGILGFTEETGKGGYHRVYHPAMTQDEFEENVVYTILMKLIILCPDSMAGKVNLDG